MDPNNPANDGPTDSQTYPGTLSVCDAVLMCAEFGYNADDAYVLDLYYFDSTASWQCIYYNNGLDNAGAYFTVANSDVSQAYSYSVVQ